MALNTNKNVKLYYSIKEVAAMFDIRESTLRFWETEFPHLKPKTVGQNVRQYTEKDIEQIRVIHNLVKVRGFKLSAARKMLNKNRTGVDKSSDILATLISVREELKELKKPMGWCEVKPFIRSGGLRPPQHQVCRAKKQQIFVTHEIVIIYSLCY